MTGSHLKIMIYAITSVTVKKNKKKKLDTPGHIQNSDFVYFVTDTSR